MDKTTELKLITPEEAVALMGFSPIEYMYRIQELQEAYKALRNPGTRWELWDDMLLLHLMYHAGRIQGIREERAKRKH